MKKNCNIILYITYQILIFNSTQCIGKYDKKTPIISPTRLTEGPASGSYNFTLLLLHLHKTCGYLAMYVFTIEWIHPEVLSQNYY